MNYMILEIPFIDLSEKISNPWEEVALHILKDKTKDKGANNPQLTSSQGPN
jgi:hypothetical protein